MKIPCYDRKAVNFLEEANNCFRSDIDLKSTKVKFFVNYLQIVFHYSVVIFDFMFPDFYINVIVSG